MAQRKGTRLALYEFKKQRGKHGEEMSGGLCKFSRSAVESAEIVLSARAGFRKSLDLIEYH